MSPAKVGSTNVSTTIKWKSHWDHLLEINGYKLDGIYNCDAHYTAGYSEETLPGHGVVQPQGPIRHRG